MVKAEQVGLRSLPKDPTMAALWRRSSNNQPSDQEPGALPTEKAALREDSCMELNNYPIRPLVY